MSGWSETIGEACFCAEHFASESELALTMSGCDVLSFNPCIWYCRKFSIDLFMVNRFSGNGAYWTYGKESRHSRSSQYFQQIARQGGNSLRPKFAGRLVLSIKMCRSNLKHAP